LNLSHFLKLKRKEEGITQLQLADMAGVGVRFVRDVEQGKASLRLDKVNTVLALFGAKMVPGALEDSDEPKSSD
jgi:y4mF family transcriptional regulator